MRTTIDIHDPLLERAKRFAAGRGKNLADVVNDALTEKLGREEQPASITRPFQMLTFGQGGTQPGVDLSDGGSIQNAMDDEHRDEATAAFNLDRMR